MLWEVEQSSKPKPQVSGPRRNGDPFG